MPKIHDRIVKRIREELKKNQKGLRIPHASNTMRKKEYRSSSLMVRDLKRVLAVDELTQTAWVEPSITMEELVLSTLHYGLIPQVVPEFKGITVGGAINGAALESSSHLFGQFNDTCLSYEILTGDGSIVIADEKHHAALFYAVAGSYGTLGTVLSVKIKLMRATKYVRVNYRHFSSIRDAVKDLKELHLSVKPPDFLEAIAYGTDNVVVIAGELTNEKRDLPFLEMSSPWSVWFYGHAKHAIGSEVMPLFDYLFRHDRGAFWMGGFAANLQTSISYLSHKASLLFGKWLDFSSKIFPTECIPKNPGFFFRSCFGWLMTSTRLFASLHGGSEEWFEKNFIIQDCYFPETTAELFLEYCLRKYRIRPLWICPVLSTTTPQLFSPHLRDNQELLFDIGVYGLPAHSSGPDAVKDLELKTIQMNGRKMFYCHSYLSEKAFWEIYPKQQYQALRDLYNLGHHYPEITKKVLVK
ncbi:Uncharacterized protein PHSC3_001527 [Chlamydiales bacterium STE3]|nr:Uncharacterized protein PHSC3_001527 [Chlamydiales bacterium STE3]